MFVWNRLRKLILVCLAVLLLFEPKFTFFNFRFVSCYSIHNNCISLRKNYNSAVPVIILSELLNLLSSVISAVSIFLTGMNILTKNTVFVLPQYIALISSQIYIFFKAHI